MAQSTKDAISGQTLMVPLAHPVLRDLTGDCVATFERATKEYLQVMKDHKNAGSTAEPVTLKSSIEPSLLSELVKLHEFEGISDVETLTDEFICLVESKSGAR